MTMALPSSARVAEQGQEPFRGRRIEIRERLVDDEQARPQHQDPGDGQELTLPAREGAGLAAEQLLDPGLLGDLADPVPDLLAGNAKVLRSEGQLGLDRRTDDLLRRVLQHGADRPREVAKLQLGVDWPSTVTLPASSPE